MDEIVRFVIEHGYLVLVVWVFADQMGLPLPAVPILLAAGALAGSGHMDVLVAVGLASAAAVLADLVWYEIGRRRGHSVVKLLCRISLEPDTCVKRTSSLFVRHGMRALVVAKFVPGLSTVAPPLAGMARVPLARFLVPDAAGTLLWVGAFLGLGWLASDQLEAAGAQALRLGSGLAVLVVAALALYVARKWVERRRVLRDLALARVAPEELKRRLDAGDEVVVVDLRSPIDLQAEPITLVGALRIHPHELEERHGEIPRDREIVLYCS